MKKLHLYLFTVSLLMIAISGCQKDIYGCTDPSAANYNSGANTNNGSCTYYGNITFWTAANFGNNITVTIQNQSATISDIYTTGQPSSCTSDPHCATFSLVQGNYNYTANCPASTQYPQGVNWSGTATVSANGCQLYQLN